MLRTFNLSCNPVDYSDNEDAVSLLSAVYIYFLTKIVDLLDTVIMNALQLIGAINFFLTRYFPFFLGSRYSS